MHSLLYTFIAMSTIILLGACGEITVGLLTPSPPSVPIQGGTVRATISSISPASGSIEGGTVVTITGTGFLENVTTVQLGEKICDAITVNNPTQITCMTPSAGVVAPVDVIVSNPVNDTAVLINGFAYKGHWSATSSPGVSIGVTNHTAVWTGSEMIIWGGTGATTNRRYDPSDNSWKEISSVNAPPNRVVHTAVWTGSEMIVWGGLAGTFSAPVALNSGGRYDPATDTWQGMSAINAPLGRGGHTAIWTGSEMIVWGGKNGFSDFSSTVFADGASYNPLTDSWTTIATIENDDHAPAARIYHTAIWTGQEMVIWGGNSLNTGSRFNPITNSWTATSVANSPTGRSGHTAVWTGSEMVVWGCCATATPGTGGRYNPLTDSWTATSLVNSPLGRTRHTAVWTGSEMIIWGGRSSGNHGSNTGGRYNPVTDSWKTTTTIDAPWVRYSHTAIWSMHQMIVWGGFDGHAGGSGYLDSGARYVP